MPTPPYQFRLDRQTKAKLEEIASVYGSPNTSAFIREIIVALVSGDVALVQGILARLTEKMTGQLNLKFEQRVGERVRELTFLERWDGMTARQKQAEIAKWERVKKPGKDAQKAGFASRGRKKGGKSRDRTTR